MKSADYAALKKLVSTDISYVVEDFIPANSVNILVGDSGLGKTPLLIQLAMCVGSGCEFLGLRVRTGPVLYVDYENSAETMLTMVEDIAEFLSIPVPATFHRYQCPESITSLALEVRALRPSLVVIDALRGLDPTAEKDNTSAAGQIAYLQKLAHECDTAFLLLHHLKKNNSEEAPEPLALAPSFMEWLERASGARALINQTDARIGIDAGTAESDLVMRWHFKTQGESGLWRIRRIVNSEYGYPIGYERIFGTALLRLQADRELYERLPLSFCYKDAHTLGARGDKSISRFLKDAIAAGLLRKTGRRKETCYHKVSARK